MAVNTYEGMFLLDSAKVAVSWDESVKHVHDILSKHQSEIVASRQWDERRGNERQHSCRRASTRRRL